MLASYRKHLTLPCGIADLSDASQCQAQKPLEFNLCYQLQAGQWSLAAQKQSPLNTIKYGQTVRAQKT
jgi:hypothetical protein